ncbi:Holliday junction branch migration DNA helicase RuvB [soil metagenome]
MSSQIVPTLDHVIGQTRAVTVLRTAIDAYFHDRTKTSEEIAFPHLLLTGPSGTGKTFLSETVAAQCCCNFASELAQNLRTPEHAHGALMMLEPGDVLFIDEIHELPQTVAVAIYRSLEERKLFLGKKHVVTLPPFCLIGATTEEHLLHSSLRQRFRIQCRLTHNSDEEMAQLIRQRANRLGWLIEEDAATQLASKSRGTPRLGIRILESAKRTASAEGTDRITTVQVERMCEIEQIDSLGLDAVEQRYLQILREGEGPVRLNVIATQMGLPRQSIEMFESDFIRLGLISKSEKGRMLTAKGHEHLSEIE